MAWHKDKKIEEWKTEICEEIESFKGWDMLFFFGHSEEHTTMGGKLGIAPGESIFMSEITPYLKTAQQKGLQFALFNSCSGLDIARSLINIGLNQVVIMREPLPDRVAPDFFQEFLKGLTEKKNVADVLYETCQTLKKNINYPSAYLIPSLFGHPSAPFYQLKPYGWKAILKEWLPNRQQAIALSTLIVISLLPFVPEFLLDKRILTQAIYRDLTSQIPNNSPPVLLISIDEESLDKAGISKEKRNPIDRQYLASIIDHLTEFNAQVIGIDYLLTKDYSQEKKEKILAQSIQDSIAKNQTKFIFASMTEGGKEIGISPEVAPLNLVMQDSILVDSAQYLEIPDNCLETKTCTFSYSIAVNQALNEKGINLDISGNQEDLKTVIYNNLNQYKNDDKLIISLQQTHKSFITKISKVFGQNWLNSLVDYSLPPKIIYQKIPAWELLEKNQLSSTKENQQAPTNQVFLIAADYPEAGIDGLKDYFPAFLGTRFWWAKYFESRDKITGGEINAYMIHHWLKQHLLTPIPDLWLILIVALLVKTIEKQLLSSANQNKNLILNLSIKNFNINLIYLLISINIIYFMVSLQIYITLNILFPFLLPSISFWTYFLLKRTSYEN
jgi:hypothetical protein